MKTELYRSAQMWLSDDETFWKSKVDPDPEKFKWVIDTILKMQKIIAADLQKAYDG